MSRILLRTLTRKSKLGFGKHKNVTVQELFDRNQALQLVSAYYKLTTINYVEDILNELGISSKWRIQKPGSDKELYYKFLEQSDFEKRTWKFSADKLKKQTKISSRSKLMGKNHGR
jgi:hypothetical protein